MGAAPEYLVPKLQLHARRQPAYVPLLRGTPGERKVIPAGTPNPDGGHLFSEQSGSRFHLRKGHVWPASWTTDNWFGIDVTTGDLLLTV